MFLRRYLHRCKGALANHKSFRLSATFNSDLGMGGKGHEPINLRVKYPLAPHSLCLINKT